MGIGTEVYRAVTHHATGNSVRCYLWMQIYLVMVTGILFLVYPYHSQDLPTMSVRSLVVLPLCRWPNFRKFSPFPFRQNGPEQYGVIGPCFKQWACVKQPRRTAPWNGTHFVWIEDVYCYTNGLLFHDHSGPGGIAIISQPLSIVACVTPWHSSHIQAYRANPDPSLQARHQRSPSRTIRETQSSEPLSPRQPRAGIRH